MTFLTPMLAIVAAAIAIPALVILYFLKLRRQPVEISTTLLWKKAIEDLQANAPFQRLRRNILLLLQFLALAAALLALAQPELSGDLAAGRRHIIMIDRSASMGATDGGSGSAPRTRLQAAKDSALELVDALREPGFLGGRADEAMVIAFDRAGEVRQNFTSNKGELRSAIESIEPTDAPTALAEPFTLAKAYAAPPALVEGKGFVATGPGATVHIFSDGRIPDAATVSAEVTDEVLYHAVGTPDAGNVAITALRAERSFDRPSQLSLLVGVQSTVRAPASVDVELAIDGNVVSVRPLTLAGAPIAAPAPGEADAPPAGGPPAVIPVATGVVFTLDRAEGGIVTARLRAAEPDPLPVDDRAYIVVPPARRVAVALVSGGGTSLFLRTALEGMNLSRLVILSPQDYQRRVDRGELGEFDLVVLHNWLPSVSRDGRPPAPGLPPGRSLVFGVVPPPPLGLVDAGPADRPTEMLDWRRDHPVLRGVSFDPVVIGAARRTAEAPGAPVTVLADAGTGPAIVEVSDAATRAVVVAFDPSESNWPFEYGFVVFTAASITYLSNDGRADIARLIRSGDVLAERLPIGAASPRITLPDGRRVDLTLAADGRVVYGPIARTGIYTVSWSGAATSGDTEVTGEGRVRRAVAANLLSPEESEIAARVDLPLASQVVEARPAGEGTGRVPLWPWCLLAVLVMLMLEWLVYNRKVQL